MKNLGKLFTVLLGALAVMAFASCSSPSSGGAKAYDYKIDFKISSPSSVAWEKTIYFKIGETYTASSPSDQDAELIPYDDEACTVALSGIDGNKAESVECYHCKDGCISVYFYAKNNSNDIGYSFVYTVDDNKCYVWVDASGVNYEDLIIDYLKYDDESYTATKSYAWNQPV